MAPQPRIFRPRPSASDEENPRYLGHIVVYGPPRPHKYITDIIYIYIYIYGWIDRYILVLIQLGG